MLIRLAQPTDDPAAVAALASRAAGVPVRYAAAVSMAWHAVLLQCADRAACEQALRGLRAAPSIESAEVDGVRRPVGASAPG